VNRTWRRSKPSRPAIAVPAGERLLAWAGVEGGAAAGTRDALYLQVTMPDLSSAAPAETIRIPWEQVQAADWDPDASTLRVAEVGHWGEPRPVHTLTVREPGRLLELVRERVTASILLQRHVSVSARRGVRVIARRAPSGAAPVTWIFEYDEGVDPDDPAVRLVADAALANAREEVGFG